MQLAQGWSVGVDRGPDWLFVTLQSDGTQSEPTELGENLWALLQCHLGNRMVLELHQVPQVNSPLLGQLVALSQRIQDGRGVLRVCGVNEQGQQAIRAAQLERLLPCYDDRASAVMGQRPRQPR